MKMRNRLGKIFVGIFLLLNIFFIPAVYAIEKYKFDPNHTYVLWNVNHFGYSKITGMFRADGVLQLDRNNLAKSKIDIVIQTNTLATGLPNFNDLLRGKNFFNIDQYPKATFVSNKIVLTGKKTATVSGILTIQDVSRPVTLKVTLNKEGPSPVNQRKTLGFTAVAQVKRSDFKMSGYIPDVSDRVDLEIEAEATIESTP